MMKKLLAIVSLSIATGSALAGKYWNVDPGGTTMKFLALQTSPRAAALSGAGIADPGRVSEVGRNPLAMSVTKVPEFGVNQIIFDGVGTDKFTSVYFGLPVGKTLAASASVDFLGYDEIEGRDENGLQTSDFGAYAWSLQIGLGNREQSFSWAFSARFASQTIDDETGYAFMGDIGGLYVVNRYLAFGATLTNAGIATAYDSADEFTPMALQAGITGKLPFSERWSLHVSADAYRRADTKAQLLLGGELSFAETLMLRAGYAIRTENHTENGISCGLGLAFSMIVLDYGYAPRPAFDGGNHHISLGLKF